MLKLVDAYIMEHAQDEWLVSALAGVEEQFNDLFSKQNEIVQKEAAQEAARRLWNWRQSQWTTVRSGTALGSRSWRMP